MLLVACLGSTCLAACATAPGVVSTEARSGTLPAESTAPPVDTTSPAQDTTVPASAQDEDGIGDELFPSLGNPGIDVEHYTIVMSYDPARTTLSATAHLDILMTEDRDEFSLDSDGPKVSAVTIDGAPAQFDAAPPELLITPAQPLTTGQRIGVDVTYALSPRPVPSTAGDMVGWFPSISGSYVLNEPEGAHTWLPSDDHPSDKATFRFEITVPSGLTAVANGGLVDHTSTVSTDTWIWEESRPMATYLIQVLTGDYEIVEDTGTQRVAVAQRGVASGPGDDAAVPRRHQRADRLLRRLLRYLPARPLRHRDHRQLSGTGDGDDGAPHVQSRRLRQRAAR